MGVIIWLIVKGTATKFSTSTTFSSENHANLMAHLAASLVWSVSSVLNISLGYTKNHRRIGYVGYFSAIFMSYYAALLSLSSLNTSISPHVVFHALYNLQVSFMTVYLLTAGVSCALNKTNGHGWYMRTAHLVLGMNFVPRVTAGVFRWYLGTYLGGDAAFSMACVAQLGWQTTQIRGAPKGEMKDVIIGTYLRCLVVAVATVGLVLTGTGMHSGAVRGLLVSFGMGWYSRMGWYLEWAL